MSDFENNKIFAAVLCALIVIWISGFAADILMHKDTHQEHAVHIDGAAHAAVAVDTKPQLPEPIMALLAQADIERGAKLSKQCAACHSFDKGGPTKQGPNLWNIVNNTKAHVSDFSYSDAMKSSEGNWTYDSLNQFLWKPKKYIPGTKMNFVGLKKPEHRAAMIAWLRTQAESQAVLPTEAEIAAEQARFAPEPEEAALDADTNVVEAIEDIVEDAVDGIVEDIIAPIEIPTQH